MQNEKFHITAPTTTSTLSRYDIPPPTSVGVTLSKFDEFIVTWIPPSTQRISLYRVVLESTDDANDALQVSFAYFLKLGPFKIFKIAF